MNADVEFPEVRQRVLAAVDLLAGPYTPDPAIRETRSWPKVVESARRAQAVMAS